MSLINKLNKYIDLKEIHLISKASLRQSSYLEVKVNKSVVRTILNNTAITIIIF